MGGPSSVCAVALADVCARCSATWRRVKPRASFSPEQSRVPCLQGMPGGCMDHRPSPSRVEFYSTLTRRAFTLGTLSLGTFQAALAQAPKVYRMAVWDISRPVTDMVEQSGATHYGAFFEEL